MENSIALYRERMSGSLREQWDASCREKAPEFLEAREAEDFEGCFHVFCEKARIPASDGRFVYFIDFDFQFRTSIHNITADYAKIVEGGLLDLLYPSVECTNDYCARHNAVVRDMILLADRVARALERDGRAMQAAWFRRLAEGPADSFGAALQRILFLNQLLWQTGSELVGLGRLDTLLFPFYLEDMEEGRLAGQLAREMIADFLRVLHRHDWFKSSSLMGDTGQVIVIGGTDGEGSWAGNELTALFLDAVRELRMPDPKLVLRTGKAMPRGLMESAVRCMGIGCGSPLLANDDVIIGALEAFGVRKEDAIAYTVSACWEPLIGGKSSSMNNRAWVVYARALHSLLMEERLDRLTTFGKLMERYWVYLGREVWTCERTIQGQSFARNTLYSVFVDGCRESKRDIMDGGARYHHAGMTAASLGNTVNALLNIKRYVYEEGLYRLSDVKRMCLLDYEGYEEAPALLAENPERYGSDEGGDALQLANELERHVTELTEGFRTRLGGKLKFGASSSNHIIEGSKAPATFDGRRAGKPFIVHISNDRARSYTEIINFAAGLDCGGNRFNGNVVDLVANPSFLERHFNKFVDLLARGTEAGYFQLQVNVVNSATLIEAKAHPERHSELIVRVWGFSAYFVALPESYQDLLIARALQSEGICA